MYLLKGVSVLHCVCVFVCRVTSAVLCELVTVDGGILPDIKRHLDFYDASFDQLQAKKKREV